MDKVKKANVNSKRLQFTPDVSEIFQSSRYLQPYSLYFHINKVICNKLNFLVVVESMEEYEMRRRLHNFVCV